MGVCVYVWVFVYVNIFKAFKYMLCVYLFAHVGNKIVFIARISMSMHTYVCVLIIVHMCVVWVSVREMLLSSLLMR